MGGKPSTTHPKQSFQPQHSLTCTAALLGRRSAYRASPVITRRCPSWSSAVPLGCTGAWWCLPLPSPLRCSRPGRLPWMGGSPCSARRQTDWGGLPQQWSQCECLLNRMMGSHSSKVVCKSPCLHSALCRCPTVTGLSQKLHSVSGIDSQIRQDIKEHRCQPTCSLQGTAPPREEASFCPAWASSSTRSDS